MSSRLAASYFRGADGVVDPTLARHGCQPRSLGFASSLAHLRGNVEPSACAGRASARRSRVTPSPWRPGPRSRARPRAAEALGHPDLHTPSTGTLESWHVVK